MYVVLVSLLTLCDNFLFQIAARILEAHSSLNKSSLIESKMLYIRQWQALPEFGLSHFIVRFRGSKKEVNYVCEFSRV